MKFAKPPRDVANATIKKLVTNCREDHKSSSGCRTIWPLPKVQGREQRGLGGGKNASSEKVGSRVMTLPHGGDFRAGGGRRGRGGRGLLDFAIKLLLGGI